MEVPSIIPAPGTLPVLRLRGGGPRRVIRRPTIQHPSRSTNTDRTVPSPLFWTPIHPILMGPEHPGAIGTPAWSHESGYDRFDWWRLGESVWRLANPPGPKSTHGRNASPFSGIDSIQSDTSTT